MRNEWLGQWVAGALSLCGMVVPLLVALASPAMTVRAMALWNGLGLLCLVAAFLVWEVSSRHSVRRRLSAWEHVIQQMRGTSLRVDTMQRHMGDIEKKAGEIAPLKQLLNEERHNLSLVASGMVEIRAIIDTEQANLGSLANGVHEVRATSDQLYAEVRRFSTEVGDFNEIVTALRMHIDGLSSNLALLDERGAIEQKNLGLVAAGLDTIRRSTSGIERFDARQAAFEDSLVLIADRVDALNGTTPDRGKEG